MRHRKVETAQAHYIQAIDKTVRQTVEALSKEDVDYLNALSKIGHTPSQRGAILIKFSALSDSQGKYGS
jgi:hypothetical protein